MVTQAAVTRHFSMSRGWFKVLYVGLTFAILLATYFLLIWPWMMRWGATDAELSMLLPGDVLVPNAITQTTRAVTIHAPPEAIYPWLLQLGVSRGGMYSHDWLENLFVLNVHSLGSIVPELQSLQEGDFISLTPPDYFVSPGPGVYVKELVPNRALIGCFGMAGTLPEPCTQTWQFVLEPQADGATRLLVRNRQVSAPLGFAAALSKLFDPVIFIMERGMLLGIKAQTEGTATSLSSFFVLAVAGWAFAVLGLAGFFLSRKKRWLWLLVPALLFILIIRSTSDLVAATAAFTAVSLIIAGALTFGPRSWPGFLALVTFVLLVLLFSAEAYITFGFTFVLAVLATFAIWRVMPARHYGSSLVLSQP